ncbi:hypothetical protein EJ02DRAFT_502497 [Clathrospora elynae]|uniref:Zn(2)-C6 fungal-type domain-containing protein n=1 Tax=Clathrospora elynae TaxID=706981 RepID=A0A6A5SSZ8_9PLEO|nr:hypothetical protein EJ02DRAFT_502497 [Clathrospora elynae]
MNTKQAACLSCRKSKIKCRREEGAPICERCQSVGVECVIPEFHIGRQKGVKNKRSGLEKAIYQVEEAIKKRRLDDVSSQSTLQHLQKLLDEAQGEDGFTQEHATESSLDGHGRLSAKDIARTSSDDQLAVEDVENPLQLLARASDLRIATPQSHHHSSGTPEGRFNGSEQSAFLDVHRFFLPMKASLDQGPGLDPIDVGLVTVDEAEMLLQYFHKKLAHTRWGLDPLVHTLPFVRTRSAFLFTTLLAMTAIFLPETSSLAKRLLLHRRFLAEQIIVRKFSSVEIVLAFMVSIPWMPSGSHASDDDTSLYLATALSIALDLSLDKVITPSVSFDQELIRQIPKAQCLHARKALAMDGFEDVETTSEWGQRLLRRRERVWIALFVLERGVCLARGRSYCVPKTSLIQHSNKWHYHTYADAQDGPLASMAVLRRDLDDLFTEVRTRCDTYRPVNPGPKIAQEIDESIESFFEAWSRAWPSVISDPESKTLPPYVEILITHTRLSTYSMLLNHPSAPPEVKRSFRKSALSSALNVMRVAIQGESRLKSMPNNTVTMICFAASVALALSAPVPVPEKPGDMKSLAPSVRHLIEDTATVLERIGSTPSHRNGASVVYGRFLRVLVKQAPDIDQRPLRMPSRDPTPSIGIPELISPSPNVDGTLVPSTSHHLGQDPLSSGYWPDTLDFSAMSYNEINETVTSADLFSTALLDLPWDDSNPLWTDWMNLPDFNYA